MPARLKKMKLRFVSLVDRGAGDGAEVVLAKRDTSCPECGSDAGESGECPVCGHIQKNDPTGSDSHVPVPMGDTGKAKQRPKGKGDMERKKLLVDGITEDDEESDEDPGSVDEDDDGEPRADKPKAKVQKNTTDGPGAHTVPPVRHSAEESMSDKIEKGDFSDLPTEVQEYIEKMEDRILEMEAAIEASEVTKRDAEPEDIFKNADPAIREHFAKMAADLTEAQEIAKAERDARLEREYLAKAESYAGLPVSAKDLAPVLKGIGDADAELLAKVEDVLGAASKAVLEGALFSEVGKRSAASETTGKVEGIAKALREADPALTEEQAFTKALEQNPALYTQYLADQEA